MNQTDLAAAVDRQLARKFSLLPMAVHSSRNTESLSIFDLADLLARVDGDLELAKGLAQIVVKENITSFNQLETAVLGQD